MNYHMGDWASRMRDHGFRVTPQRQLILEAIYESGGHTTPEEIYERVHAKAPAVNLATIYRTVDFLRELRLITEMHVGGKTYYEIAGEAPHHHLVCRRCGHVEQIDHATWSIYLHGLSTNSNSRSKRIIWRWWGCANNATTKKCRRLFKNSVGADRSLRTQLYK